MGYILAYKNILKLSNISSFKINGNNLNYLIITPIEDCIVEFGDGNKQVYSGNNQSTYVYYTYSTPGEYIVNIIGNHSTFKAPSNIVEIISLSNSITSCDYMFENCTMLTNISENFQFPSSVTSCVSMFSGSAINSIPILFKFSNSITNCSSMFSMCNNLKEIPETFILPNSIINCSTMFHLCSNLTAASENFKLPESITNCSYMFDTCRALTLNISNIWPNSWKSNNIIMDNMFYECRSIIGIVPADKLWNSGKSFSATGCFYNCTNLTNYSEIPSNWIYS